MKHRLEKIVCVHIGGSKIPILVVSRNLSNGDHMVRPLTGKSGVYVMYHGDGHHHMYDRKAPPSAWDEERVQIARKLGYKDPEHYRGLRGGCSQRQPVAELRGNERVAVFEFKDVSSIPVATKYLNKCAVEFFAHGPGVSFAVYLSESGEVSVDPDSEVQEVFDGQPKVVVTMRKLS